MARKSLSYRTIALAIAIAIIPLTLSSCGKQSTALRGTAEPNSYVSNPSTPSTITRDEPIGAFQDNKMKASTTPSAVDGSFKLVVPTGGTYVLAYVVTRNGITEPCPFAENKSYTVATSHTLKDVTVASCKLGEAG